MAGYCSLECAPILLASSTLRFLRHRPRGRGWAKIRTNPGGQALLRRFPTGLGRSFGGWRAPAAGPLQPPGRLVSGRPPGCRAPRPPASCRCESPRAGPAPTPTNSTLPGSRSREGPPQLEKAQVRASSRWGAARGSRTQWLYHEKGLRSILPLWWAQR